MNTNNIRLIVALAIMGAAIGACGRSDPKEMKELGREQAGDYTVVLLNERGSLVFGKNTLLVEFRRMSDNRLVDIGEVRVSAAMIGMNMSSETSVEKTDTPGRYDMKADLSMAGRWKITLTFGNNDSARFSLSAL